MLANETLMTAAKEATRKTIAAALRADPRVIFAFVAARVSAAACEGRGEPCVAVYVEAADDPATVRIELAERMAAEPGLGRVDVAMLNDMDLDEAGRMLEEADLLVDRDPERRVAYALLAAGAYLDFRESEAVFLRERAERPYADTMAIKLAQLDELIGRLRELRGLTADAYLADWKAAYVAERALEVAIGLCIDLARHVVAERATARPLTYRETFAIARDAGLLGPSVAAALMGMCGFRNRLAHEGTRLDATIVVRMVESSVEDLGRFRDAVSRL
jgi:uncharacterized protein YutE (UPF0331/DUF86 family)